ncbi:extracellular solute-binding protein [Nocardioides sp. B-3]|nr:extracellular solute-binding protein [Nocardioides sp. B-3]
MEARLTEQSFEGATAAATWEGEVVAFPFWSNTQVLWYRKSFVEKAGLDMSQPVTWDQIIDAASENGGKIGVRANKYEGYSVWINALISGAGGNIVEDAEQGADATITVDSDAGETAAGIIEKLASSEAAPADLSVSNEGTAGSTFGSDEGSFPGQLDLHLEQLRRGAARRRHRLRHVSAVRGGRGVASAVRRDRHRGQ